ncbi:MAG TPA: hypothetical protein VFO23_12420, partial [Steroidobacteraceae bacterium]|nr:hypothetical protein [Steroidobacteraceae bacterium]
GSMAESFASLGDSIYFHDADGVYVNLFAPSTLDWQERGIRLTQETRFPEDQAVRLRVHSSRPARFALRLRMPSWSRAVAVRLNGKALASSTPPGNYLSLARSWHDGDEVTLQLPMHLHTVPMPDDPTLQAVMYGPLVLAGRLGSAGLTAATLRAPPTQPRKVPEYTAAPVEAPPIVAPGDDPASWLAPVPGRALEFTTRGQREALAVSPLSRIFDERYVVYWRVTRTA